MSKIPATIFSTTQKIVMMMCFLLFVFSLWQEEAIFMLVMGFRFEYLNSFMSFVTNLGLFYASGALAVYILFTKQYRYFILLLLTIIVSMESGFVLKKVFSRPRPFHEEVLSATNLIETLGYAFPSMHAIFCFSIWPYLERIFKNKVLRFIGYTAIITIVFSRIYVGVHYASDLFIGSIMGFMMGKWFLYMEDQYKILEWFQHQIKSKFELRRQFGHMITGLIIVVLLKYEIITSSHLFAILIVGGIASLISRKHKIPFLYTILKFFERPKEIEFFPGKGSFFLVLGSFLTTVLFPKDIALAAITIMAVGDALTTLIGTYFGKMKNPLNPTKHLEGTMVAIICSTIAAFTFVSFEKAFLGSVVGMVFESITIRFLNKAIDDNVLIPLIAGLAMMALS